MITGDSIVIGPQHKGFPAILWGSRTDDLDEPLASFSTPVVTLDRAAVINNTSVMARYAGERGLQLAPHGKTTMAPALWRALLEHGAWSLTLATGWQVQLAWSQGIRRVLMPAPPLDPGFRTWLATARPKVWTCCAGSTRWRR